MNSGIKHAVIAVLVFLLMVCIILSLTGCNKDIFDLNYSFNYAYIDIPGGQHIEGKVQSWTDYDDGDQLQIKIDGVTYLTNSSRVVLCNK